MRNGKSKIRFETQTLLYTVNSNEDNFSFLNKPNFYTETACITIYDEVNSGLQTINATICPRYFPNIPKFAYLPATNTPYFYC